LAAGGEPAHPALNGGRDLKQRRIGLFWSLPAFHRRRGLLKRLVLHCQVSGREKFPNQSTAAQFGSRVRGFVASPSCDYAKALTSENHLERVPSLGPFWESAMTERIQEFLRNRRSEGLDTEPCLVVDLEVVRDNYQTFAKALPDSRVFYAVKANPAPEVLSLLAQMGSCFDTATVAEIEMALAAGATADRISYGNTIKKERDIARAFALGIRLFAVDCAAEVEKIARAAPGAKVFCRILYDCAGAEWPLSRKFGCDPEMAVDVLDLAKRLGLEPCGISFHVGSQQRKVKAWDRALAMASSVFRDCAERGINLTMVNMGGGFPTKYLKDVPPVVQYGRS